MGILLMGILIEVIDPGGIEAAGPALDAMHLVALLQKKLSQIRAILASDASNQSYFHQKKAMASKRPSQLIAMPLSDLT